jgi:hypothetical protein
MQKYKDLMGSKAEITPHLIISKCNDCTTTEIHQNCISTSEGTFCAPLIKTTNMTGIDSIRLGLSEICIHRTYKNENNGQKWWAYFNAVVDCHRNNFQPWCVEAAKRQVGIDFQKIEECIRDEGQILKKDYNLGASVRFPYSPAIVINKQVYRVLS